MRPAAGPMTMWVNSMTRTPARGNPCRPAITLPLVKTCHAGATSRRARRLGRGLSPTPPPYRISAFSEAGNSDDRYARYRRSRQRSGPAGRPAEHQVHHADRGQEGLDRGGSRRRRPRDRGLLLRAGETPPADGRCRRGRGLCPDDSGPDRAGAGAQLQGRRERDRRRRPQDRAAPLRQRDPQQGEPAQDPRGGAGRRPPHRRTPPLDARRQAPGLRGQRRDRLRLHAGGHGAGEPRWWNWPRP